MTVIRPNSISGITSITAQANEINIFRSDGTLAGLQINGVNFNTTTGVSTFNNLDVGGVLTYQDVTNVDSVGIITARSTIDAQGDISIVDKIIHTGDTNTSIRFPADDTFAVETAGSERLRVDSNGDIYTSGAGVRDDARLTIAKNKVGVSTAIHLHNSNGSGTASKISASKGLILSADVEDNTNADRSFISLHTDNIERLHIKSDGNVGIGTDNPLQRLHVKQGSTTTPAMVEALGAKSHVKFQHNAGSNYTATIGSKTLGSGNVGLTFDTGHNGDVQRMVIDVNGKIGIGTISPTYGLDIMHDTGLMIRSSTNGVGAAISFTDASINNWDQIGTIKYLHQDNVVENGISEGFIIQGTESTTAVKIEGLLRVTAQPCAVVYECTGPAGGAANATSDNKEPLHFNHVHINQGGMTISQNNARIQVPVTGIYFVSYMVSGTVTNVDLNDGIELILLVNGNEYPASNSGAEPVFNFGASANAEEYFANNTLLVSLSKDDYVEVAVDNIGSSDANINRGNFNVMLMA